MGGINKACHAQKMGVWGSFRLNRGLQWGCSCRGDHYTMIKKTTIWHIYPSTVKSHISPLKYGYLE